MRLTPVLSLLLMCGAGAASLSAQVPVMQKVLPDSGKTGSVLKIQGVYLDKTKVDEVYLSDHTFDMKVKVLEQNDDSIEFRIPPFAKPGRLQLVVKTTGKEPVILEQPVYITVEEPKETLQATATNPPANGTK
ncbi:MAG: IPT/TIG domain-containing protein [Bryobacteraceae bacterium]